jgi:hypothetical protein
MNPIQRVFAPPTANNESRAAADAAQEAMRLAAVRRYKGILVKVNAQKAAAQRAAATAGIAAALGRAPVMRAGVPAQRAEKADKPESGEEALIRERLRGLVVLPQIDIPWTPPPNHTPQSGNAAPPPPSHSEFSAQDTASRHGKAGARPRRATIHTGPAGTEASAETTRGSLRVEAQQEDEEGREADLAWRPRIVLHTDNSAPRQSIPFSLAMILQDWWANVRSRKQHTRGGASSAALMSFSRWTILHAPELAPKTLAQCAELLEVCEGLAVPPGPDIGDEPSPERALNLLLPLWLLHLSRPRTPAQQQRALERLDVLRHSP